ncbi:MAG: MBL fold metallo-hydrolase [Rickettsiales bacterium]|jgi:glyoxylase-like metal-dependent hydrolase (beta-lactamase superfamily II)|nr:MBL fold metallo-hydrolase [Rickettsiales bacterium]
MPPENTNSVLVTNGALAAVFDPWGTTENWLKLLRDENLTLKNIFCTHGHYDHVSAIPGLIADTGAKWFMHPDDIPVIEWSNEILPRIGAKKIDLKKIPPCPIAPGAMEILPGLSAEAIHTPGHSAGSIAFYFPNEKLLIAGDTIFQDGYGRTDLPTGSESHMRESLKKIRNMNLADDTTVIHGHGPDTTIGYLKEKNPFFCL